MTSRRFPRPAALCLLLALALLLPALNAPAGEFTALLHISVDKQSVAAGDILTAALHASGNPQPAGYGFQITAHKDGAETEVPIYGHHGEHTLTFSAPDCDWFEIVGFSYCESTADEPVCDLLAYDSLVITLNQAGPLQAVGSIRPNPLAAGKEAVFEIAVEGDNPPYTVSQSATLSGPYYYKTLFGKESTDSASRHEYSMTMPEYGREVVWDYIVEDAAGRMFYGSLDAPVAGGDNTEFRVTASLTADEISSSHYLVTVYAKPINPIGAPDYQFDWAIIWNEGPEAGKVYGNRMKQPTGTMDFCYFEAPRESTVYLMVHCTDSQGRYTTSSLTVDLSKNASASSEGMLIAARPAGIRQHLNRLKTGNLNIPDLAGKSPLPPAVAKPSVQLPGTQQACGAAEDPAQSADPQTPAGP